MTKKKQESPQEQQQDEGSFISDPTISRTFSEDPLFCALRRWWQPFAVVIISVMVIRYAVDRFNVYRTANVRQAADVFYSLRSDHRQLSYLIDMISDGGDEASDAAAADSRAAQRKVVEERFKELLASLTDTRAPYSELARVYKALNAREAGDEEAALEGLSGIGWSTNAKLAPEKALIAELGVLVQARIHLDREEGKSRARELLIELAQHGQYANVAAAEILSRVSLSPEEKLEALRILNDLVLRHPEQGVLVRGEIERLQSNVEKLALSRQ